MLILNDSQPRGLGYLEVDHKASGELPAGVRTRHFEADTYTCSHCHAVVILNPLRVRERYKCSGCNHHICDECAAKRVAGGRCRTLQQVFDEMMERAMRQPGSGLIILP